MVIGACVNASLSRESVLFNRDVVHRHGCMSGTRMHLIEVATHLLGGQHGEESESEEEDREEGEAEGQALNVASRPSTPRRRLHRLIRRKSSERSREAQSGSDRTPEGVGEPEVRTSRASAACRLRAGQRGGAIPSLATGEHFVDGFVPRTSRRRPQHFERFATRLQCRPADVAPLQNRDHDPWLIGRPR